MAREALEAGEYYLFMHGLHMTCFLATEAGEHESISIDAPPPAIGDVMQLNNVLNDGTAIISESSGVGAVAAPRLSTLLTLAGAASLVDARMMGAANLRAIGVSTFATKMPQEESGTMLLVADETDGSQLARARVRIWPLDKPAAAPRALLPVQHEHPAEYAQPASPGAYWIAIEAEGEPSFVFASAVVRRRVHMVVLARGAAGAVQMFEYLPLTHGTREHPQQLRLLEMMQRHYAAGSVLGLGTQIRSNT